MKDRKKYYCSEKGCTRQVYRQGLCNAHLKEKEAATAISEKPIVSYDYVIKKMAVGDVGDIVKTETRCKCKSPMKLLGDECVIKLYEGEGGYGAVKIYHRNNLLHSAIGLIERVKTEKEN